MPYFVEIFEEFSPEEAKASKRHVYEMCEPSENRITFDTPWGGAGSTRMRVDTYTKRGSTQSEEVQLHNIHEVPIYVD